MLPAPPPHPCPALPHPHYDSANGQTTVTSHDKALPEAMESVSNHRVASHLSMKDHGVPWLLSSSAMAERLSPNQSDHSKHGVWLISLRHVCRQSYGGHGCQPESHSGTDVGHKEAGPVFTRHQTLLPRNQVLSHKKLSARQQANRRCAEMMQPKMKQTKMVSSDST